MSVVEPETNMRKVYDQFQNRLDAFRKHHSAPLTLAEKVVYAHLDDTSTKVTRGKTYLNLRPDRVAMQVSALSVASRVAVGAALRTRLCARRCTTRRSQRRKSLRDFADLVELCVRAMCARRTPRRKWLCSSSSAPVCRVLLCRRRFTAIT